jgi:hypothetical protein
MKGKQNLMKRKGFVNYGSDSGYPEAVLESLDKPVDLSELKLSELRELYPNIKAVSKKEFLKELKESQDV